MLFIAVPIALWCNNKNHLECPSSWPLSGLCNTCTQCHLECPILPLLLVCPQLIDYWLIYWLIGGTPVWSCLHDRLTGSGKQTCPHMLPQGDFHCAFYRTYAVVWLIARLGSWYSRIVGQLISIIYSDITWCHHSVYTYSESMVTVRRLAKLAWSAWPTYLTYLLDLISWPN